MSNTTGTAMLALWNTVGTRFRSTVSKLAPEEMNLKIGSASIGYMARHNAEVEYMFADWYFGKGIPEEIEMLTSKGPAQDDTDYSDVGALVQFLEASNLHMIAAMEALSEEAWHQPVSSPMGPSTTPVESIGRLIYHTGLHAGQISLIQKNAPRDGE